MTNKIFQKCISLVLLLSYLFYSQAAWGLPSDYQVESGTAQFDTTDPNSLIIHASDNAIINFGSFSIAQNETVRFVQDSNSNSVLSRVTGGSASDIYGSLFSNGTLFFVNQNGINFHEGANVQVGSLIASTLNIQSAMYLNQQYTFEKEIGSNPGRILNEANIYVNGGSIALLAEDIQNRGVLQANLGTVALGIGERQTLSFDANGMISLVIDKGLADTLGKSITNSGTVQADGGKVLLSAKTFNATMDTIINNTGILQATRAFEKDGKIIFESNTGNENSGTINTNVFDERGYSFRNTSTAAMFGGQAFYDNLDGAANISGSIGSDQSDVGDLIVTGDITLTANVIFTADSDNSGVGKFDMNSGTTISGFRNLTIKTGQDSNLYALTNITQLILDRAGSSSTPTYTMNGTIAQGNTNSLTVSANTTLNLNGNSLTASGGSASTINNGTIKLLGNETTTNIGNFDLDSGTVVYLGSGASSYTLKDFGATDYYNLVINATNGSATETAGANTSVAGTLTVTSGTYDASGFTTTVTGLATVNGGAYTYGGQDQTFNSGLTLSSGTFTSTATGNTDVNGTLTLSGGIFTAPQGNMYVSGNFTHSSGTFTHNNGAVILDGTSQQISGNTTFYNFTKSVAAADTLTFAASSTTTISNSVTLNGASSQLLSLRSSSTGSYWNINLPGTGSQTLSYLDVKDSNNTGTKPNAITGVVNSGHTANWFTLYTWNGSSGTNFSTAGSWDLGSAPGSADDVVIADVANDPVLSLDISIGSLTINSLGILDLNGHNLTLGGTFTNNGTLRLQNSETLTGFTNDTDSGSVYYYGTAAYTSLKAGNSYYDLSIDGSGTGTYTLNNNLDVNRNFTISSGTLDVKSGSNYQITVGGNFNAAGGTFTPRSGTVVFDATDLGHTVTDGGNNWYNVTFNGSGGGWSFADSTVIGNDLTMTAGTVLGTNDITVNGGDVTGDGLLSLTAGTFLVDGTGNFGGNSAGWSFNHLTFGDGSGSATTTKTGSAYTTVNGNFSIAANQTLDAGNDTWYVGGNFSNAGNFGSNASTFDFTKAVGTQTVDSAGNSFYNLTHSGAGTLQVINSLLSVGHDFSNSDSSGIFDLNGQGVSISGNESNVGTIQLIGTETAFIGGTHDVDSGTWLYVGDGTGGGADTYTIKNLGGAGVDYFHLRINSTDANDIYQLGAGLVTDGTLRVSAGTFDETSYGVTINGLATVDGGTYLGNALGGSEVFNAGFTMSSGTYTGSAYVMDVNGAFTLSGGVFTAPQGMTVSGNFAHSAGTFTAGSGSVILDGGYQTVSGSTTFYNLNKAVTSADTLTFQAATTQTITNSINLHGVLGQKLSLVSDDPGVHQWSIDLPGAGSRTLDYLTVTDSINTDAVKASPTNSTNGGGNTNWFGSTLTWTGTTNTDFGTATNWDLNAAPTSADDVVIADVTNDPIFGGDFSLTSITINSLGLLNLNGHNLTMTGTFINNGTLKLQGGETLTGFTNDTDTGTIEYNGSGSYASLIAGNSYNNLTFSGAGSWTLNSALDVNNNITISAGTLDTKSGSNYQINVGNNWNAAGGTFTARSGTVVFDATDTGNTITDGGSNWYNATFNGSGGGWSFADSTLLSGDLTVTAGTFSGTNDIQVNGGDVTGNGTINLTGGGFYMNGTGNFGGNTAWTFYDMIFGTSGSNTTTKTGSGSITAARNFTIGGSQTLDAADDTWYVGGNFTNSSLFTASTSTFEFTKTSGTQTVDNSVSSFYNLNHSGAGTLQLESAITVNNDINLYAGTLDTKSGFNYQINVGGNWYSTTPTFISRNGTVVFTKSSGTQTVSIAESFYNLTHSGAGTLQLESTLDVNNNLTNSAGTLDTKSGSNYQINVGGDWDSTGGTFTPENGTVVFDATSSAGARTITDGGNNWYNVTFNGSGGGWSFADSTVIGNDLTVTTGTLAGLNSITVNGGDVTGNGTINLTGGTFLLDATGNFGGNTGWTFNNLTFGGGLSGATTTTKTGSNAITATGNFQIAQTLDASDDTWNIGGNWTNEGTFTANASTVVFNATDTGHDIYDGGANWYNVTFSGSGGGWSFADSTVIGNDLIVTTGTLSGTNNITVNGGDVTGNGTINLTGGTFLLDGTGNFGGNTGWTFNNLTFGDGSITTTTTKTGSDAITVSGNFSIADKQTLDASDDTWNVDGNFSAVGPLTASTSTFNFTKSSGTQTLDAGGSGFYNVTHSGAGTLQLLSNLDANNNITLSAGTLDVTLASNYQINVGNNWDATGGTFTARNGTVVFDATGTGKTITDGGSNWYNVTFNGSGGGWSFADSTVIGNDLTMTAGTLSGTNSITVNGGDVTGNGTINLTGGTFLLDGTGNFGGNTDWNFGGLTFGDGSGSTTTTKTGSSQMTATSNFSIAANQTLDAGDDAWSLTGNYSNAGTLTASTSTFNFGASSGTQTLDAGGSSFYNLTHSGAGTLQLTNNTLTVGQNFANSDSSGTLDLNGRNFTVSGIESNDGTIKLRGSEVVTLSGTHDVDSGTWRYVGTGSATTYTILDFGGTDYYNLSIAAIHSSDIYQAASAKVIAGALTVSNGTYDANGNMTTVTGVTTTSAGASTYLASTATQTFNGGLTINGGTFTGSSGLVDLNGNFSQAGGTFTGPTSMNMSGSTFSLTSGTFNAPTTLTFDGTSNVTLTTGSRIFNNFVINNTGSSGSDRLIVSGSLDIDGNLTVTDGDLRLSTNNPNVNTAGNVTIGASGSVTKGSGTWTFDGSGTSTLQGNSQDFGAVTVDGSSKTLQMSTSGATFSTLTIGGNDIFDANTIDLAISTLSNNNIFRLQGSETITLAANDTDSGTWQYVGNGTGFVDTYTIKDFGSGTDYYNLSIASTHIADIYQSSAAKTIAGALTVSNGTFDANGNTTAVTGLTTVSGGTYQASTATQTFTAGLTVSGGTFTGSSGTVDVDGIFTLSSGTFTAPTLMTVADDFLATGGTFSHNTGRVTLDGAAAATVDAPLAGLDFYDFYIGAGKTIQFTGGDTFNVLSASTFSIGNNVTLTSTNTTQWNLSINNGAADGIAFGTGDSVAYSNNTSVNVIETTGVTGVGNTNTRWTFDAADPTPVVPYNCADYNACVEYINPIDPPVDPIIDHDPVQPPPVEPTHPVNPVEPGFGPPVPYIVPVDEKGNKKDSKSTIFVTEGAVYVRGVDGEEEMLYDGESMSVSKQGASILRRGIYVSTLDGLMALRGKTYKKMKEFKWDSRPSALAASKEGDAVYAANPQGNELIRVDTTTFDSKNIRGLEEGANAISLNRAGDMAFVTDARGDKAQVFDTKTQKILKEFPVGSMPTQAVLSGDEKYLYVVERLDATVSQYEISSGNKVASVKAGVSPYGIALAADQKTLYVTDTMSNKVLVFDSELQKQKEIGVGKNPQAIIQDPKENKIYLANRSGESISVIDADAKDKVSTIQVGKRPASLAILPEGNTIYVANELSHNLSVVDLKQGRAIQEIPTGMAPNQVVISSPASPKR